MPPKKVVAPPPPTDPSEMSPALQQQLANTEGMSEFELPKTTLAKLAKGSVPGYVKMQQEVGMALNRGSTLFINYLTAAAHDQAHARSGRQITAADVLKAIAELDFGPADNLIPQLEIELAAFRARQEAIKASKAKPAGPGRGRKRKSEAGGEGDDVEMAEDDEEEEAEGVDGAEDEDETEDPAPTIAGDSRIPDDQDDGAS